MRAGTRGRRGSVLVMIAGGLTMLLACGAWTVDLAAGLQARTRQQLACDAAALAGVMELAPPAAAGADQQARAVAAQYAALNGEPVPEEACVPGTLPSGARTMTVQATRPVSAMFGAAVGLASFDVVARSRATLGSPVEIPAGYVPLGLPAYKNGGDWLGLTGAAPDTYAPLRVDPATGVGTRITIKVTAGDSRAGNFLALSIDGRGGNEYRHDLANGASTPLDFGTDVDSQPGGLVGPTEQGLRQRIDRGDLRFLVPLIDKTDWDLGNGRTPYTIIGFIAVKLIPVPRNQPIVAEFERRVLTAPGSQAAGSSPGVYVPLLILPAKTEVAK